MKTPIVSVILPTYNGSKYLAKSIESVLQQSYRFFELIIINDASTDATPDIIKHYERIDPRVINISNKKNKKLPKSLNIGHSLCRGKFISWTSDDNYYHERAIEIMLDNIEKFNVGMVYCDYYKINLNDEIVGKVKVNDYKNLSNYDCIGACFLYRTKVYQQTGDYSIKSLFSEDYDYWLRIATKFEMLPIHKELYFYRVHSDSLTSKTNKQVLKRSKDLALSRSVINIPWLSKDEKFDKIIGLTSNAMKRHDFTRVIRYALTALAFSPGLFLKKVFLKLKDNQ
jgi:glycosyltransferase involved in cell wall biosynthesis